MSDTSPTPPQSQDDSPTSALQWWLDVVHNHRGAFSLSIPDDLTDEERAALKRIRREDTED